MTVDRFFFYFGHQMALKVAKKDTLILFAGLEIKNIHL